MRLGKAQGRCFFPRQVAWGSSCGWSPSTDSSQPLGEQRIGLWRFASSRREENGVKRRRGYVWFFLGGDRVPKKYFLVCTFGFPLPPYKRYPHKRHSCESVFGSAEFPSIQGSGQALWKTDQLPSFVYGSGSHGRTRLRQSAAFSGTGRFTVGRPKASGTPLFKM